MEASEFLSKMFVEYDFQTCVLWGKHNLCTLIVSSDQL